MHRRCCQQATSSVHYTTSCKYSLVLLKMGEIFARNMLSWLKLVIKLLLYLVSCLHYCINDARSHKHQIFQQLAVELDARKPDDRRFLLFSTYSHSCDRVSKSDWVTEQVCGSYSGCHRYHLRYTGFLSYLIILKTVKRTKRFWRRNACIMCKCTNSICNISDEYLMNHASGNGSAELSLYIALFFILVRVQYKSQCLRQQWQKSRLLLS